MKIERILVVEDEIYLLETMVEILKEDLGYDVITAINKEETIQKTLSELPDLILLDVELEKKEDGIVICEKLKKNKKTANIPIVMVSAHIRTSDVRKGLDAGAEDYITKPFNIAKLGQIVKRVEQKYPYER